MNSHILPATKITDEEIEYYGEKYRQNHVAIKEQIIFEHYLQREIMLKNRSSRKVMRAFAQ